MAFFSLGNKKNESGTSAQKNDLLKSDIIISSIEDGVISIDAKGQITSLNPAAAKISGWPPEEAAGLDFKNVLKLVTESDQPYTENDNPLLACLKTGQPVRDSNAVLVARDNKKVAISISAAPLGNGQGSTSGVVAVFRDVSKEKAEERQRAEFISTASHEMRTPIAAIEGYLALALNEKVSTIDSNARQVLEKAHSSTKHLGKLFQDLLTSSRAEDGRLQSNPTVIEMGELVQQVSDDARFNAQAKGLELDYVFGAQSGEKTIRPLYYAYADPNRIREVLQNLVDNAIKYTLNGRITIKLTGDPNVVQVQVHDTGPGISSDDIPHLFQKFYRVDSSLTRSVGGTGLGLFICRKIIELYSGHIWVESELDKGSTFYINLPRLTKERALQLQQEQASHMSVLDNM